MTTSKKLRDMKLPPGYNACLLLDAAAEIDRLTSERDALARDAQRFGWLLNQELPDWMDVYHQHPDRVRAAIDAQIEQERSND